MSEEEKKRMEGGDEIENYESAGSDNDGAKAIKKKSVEGLIQSVSIKIPPFWCGNIELWFSQVEGAFNVKRIRSDKTKFDIIISSLDSKTLNQVANSVINPPAENKYLNLKSELTRVFSDSKTARMHKLLSGIQLGDKKPSRLLAELRAVAQPTLDDELLETIWIQRLPVNIQTVLAAVPGDLTQRAIIADAVLETTEYAGHSSSLQAITTDQPRTMTSTINNSIMEVIDKRFDDLSIQI